MKVILSSIQKEKHIPRADQKFLARLGLISHTARIMGLGLLLRITRDMIDLAFLKLKKFPLNVYIDGHVIYGCLRHRSFLHHISTVNYEPFTTELFKKNIRPGMTVVDGGAHIGFYTLLAARLAGPNGKVFSFEADNYNFQSLLFNIDKNKYKNVNLINKVVSDKSGILVFYQSSGTIGSSLGDRKENTRFIEGIYVKKIQTQSTTVDIELDNTPIDVIKLDIEGAEPLAIQGMSRTLEKNRSLTLFVEVNSSALVSLGTSPEVLVRKLKDLGFEICFIDESNRRLVPLIGESAPQKGNLYCKRGIN